MFKFKLLNFMNNNVDYAAITKYHKVGDKQG